MRKFYSLFLLVVLILVSMTAETDTHIKLNVDDASRVSVKVNYSSVPVIAGVNEFTVSEYGTVEINATEGNYLKKVVRESGSNVINQTINSLTNCNIYVSSTDEGATYNVNSANLEDARTASCTVTVDNSSKVSFQRGGSGSRVNLQNGTNTIK